MMFPSNGPHCRMFCWRSDVVPQQSGQNGRDVHCTSIDSRPIHNKDSVPSRACYIQCFVPCCHVKFDPYMYLKRVELVIPHSPFVLYNGFWCWLFVRPSIGLILGLRAHIQTTTWLFLLWRVPPATMQTHNQVSCFMIILLCLFQTTLSPAQEAQRA